MSGPFEGAGAARRPSDPLGWAPDPRPPITDPKNFHTISHRRGRDGPRRPTTGRGTQAVNELGWTN
jgi:hypothetical protein